MFLPKVANKTGSTMYKKLQIFRFRSHAPRARGASLCREGETKNLPFFTGSIAGLWAMKCPWWHSLLQKEHEPSQEGATGYQGCW